MSFLARASNALTRSKNALVRAAPVIHKVRQWSDVAGAAAQAVPLLPGASVVRAVFKGISFLDNSAQKLANA